MQEAASRRPSRSELYGCLAGLVVVWAGNFPLIKAALADIGPLAFTAIRYLGAAAVSFAVCLALRLPPLPARAERPALAITGLLQLGATSSLSSLGLMFAPPGRAAILVYSMPLWAVPIGALVAGEPYRLTATIGVLVGFAGLMIFLNPWDVSWNDTNLLLGYALLLGCAV